MERAQPSEAPDKDKLKGVWIHGLPRAMEPRVLDGCDASSHPGQWRHDVSGSAGAASETRRAPKGAHRVERCKAALEDGERIGASGKEFCGHQVHALAEWYLDTNPAGG